MKTLQETPIWAPTPAELREIDKRVRAERAKAFNGAVAYVARKVGNAFTNERAADRIELQSTHAR